MTLLPQRQNDEVKTKCFWMFIHQIRVWKGCRLKFGEYFWHSIFQLWNEMCNKSSLMRKAFSATVIANYFKEIGSCHCSASGLLCINREGRKSSFLFLFPSLSCVWLYRLQYSIRLQTYTFVCPCHSGWHLHLMVQCDAFFPWGN